QDRGQNRSDRTEPEAESRRRFPVRPTSRDHRYLGHRRRYQKGDREMCRCRVKATEPGEQLGAEPRGGCPFVVLDLEWPLTVGRWLRPSVGNYFFSEGPSRACSNRLARASYKVLSASLGKIFTSSIRTAGMAPWPTCQPPQHSGQTGSPLRRLLPQGQEAPADWQKTQPGMVQQTYASLSARW